MFMITRLRSPGIAEAVAADCISSEAPAIVAIVERHFPGVSGSALTPPHDLVALRAALRAAAPRLAALAESLLYALCGGLSAVTLDRLGLGGLDLDGKRKLLYAFSALMGQPSAADPRERRVVWDVKRSEQSGEYFATFSEHDGEADYHTDTQYWPHPERYFLLYVVEPARCGGGMLLMRNGRTLKSQLLATPRGREAVRVLSQTPLPFRVPSAFSCSGSAKEFTYARVFDDEVFLRWRSDTIRKGLEEHPNSATGDVLHALECVESFLADAPEHSMLLDKDSVCVVDNHVVLHGRTGFADHNRHLIRIRFHSTPARTVQ